ncbi:long-chain acyl-CoA synthetase/crotonobetaine/carnitine-CoA ligase [Halorientalis regularis]|uniref:Long-chain acyl-CoA synthetase/crotonobetaine/carnitine-CoA ligase n=2 Tax=Halorientalis regularis TaxID=660518 RepID=A0A1G7RUT8_9EURY|nr:long-chain acyl-CoA synthetase/crotonobetaine/carnitine-CoA ligase [Halorientalis regularis]
MRLESLASDATRMSRADADEYETITTLLADRAASKGTSPLVHTAGGSYSYRELHERSNAIANALVERGTEPGDRICTFLRNSPEYLAVWFGIAKAGAVMISLHNDLRDDSLSYVLRDSSATTIFLDSSTRENYETVRSEPNEVTSEFLLGDHPPESSYQTYESLLDFDQRSSPDHSPRPSDPMSVIYTSGTTGKPKGVILPHYSYINTGREFVDNVLDLDQSDRAFTTLPLSHCNAQQTTVTGSILAGIDFVLYEEFDPDRFWDQIRRHDATVFSYLGTMITNLHNTDPQPDDADNPAVYGIGAGAPAGVIDEFEPRFDVQLLEGYGLTETATMAAVNPPEASRSGSIGKPLSYTEIEVVDEEDRPLPPGEDGEIVVRPTEPNSFMLGYHDKPDETVDAWQNLWFHTGDVGYKDEDNYFYFVDRKAYAIRRPGGNVSSHEVENVLSDHPDLQEAAVFGVPNEQGDEAVKAVVVPKPGTDPSPVDIVDHCDGRLAYFKVPRYITIRDELPKTATERVKKYELIAETDQDTWDRERGYELKR